MTGGCGKLRVGRASAGLTLNQFVEFGQQVQQRVGQCARWHAMRARPNTGCKDGFTDAGGTGRSILELAFDVGENTIQNARRNRPWPRLLRHDARDHTSRMDGFDRIGSTIPDHGPSRGAKRKRDCARGLRQRCSEDRTCLSSMNDRAAAHHARLVKRADTHRMSTDPGSRLLSIRLKLRPLALMISKPY
jgi:hypothetical protein